MPATAPTRRRKRVVTKPRSSARPDTAVLSRLERLLASISMAKAALTRN